MHAFIQLILLAAVVLWTSVAQSDPTAPTGANASAMSKDAQATPKTLAARFEIRITDPTGQTVDKGEWYWMREPNRIETFRPNLQIAEVWERNERGDLSLRRIFPADRRVVDYQPGDLRAMHIEPVWSSLGSVLDPRLLDRLKAVGVKKLPEGDAVAYTGEIDGEQIEVWWLEDASLPARLVRRKDKREFTLTLQALFSTPPVDWPRIHTSVMSEYRVIDAADLGDMQYDPFVHKLEQFDAAASGFRHEGHTHP